MLATYGYKDGSGEYFITIDTDRCSGCGSCASACPKGIFRVGEDSIDPFRETPVAMVKEEMVKKLGYLCLPCKGELPCVSSCPEGAITHFLEG